MRCIPSQARSSFCSSSAPSSSSDRVMNNREDRELDGGVPLKWQPLVFGGGGFLVGFISVVLFWVLVLFH